jgi:hypothetical protein
VYANGQARVAFRSRANLFSPPPTWIIDGANRQIAPTTTFRNDVETVVNRALVSRPVGATQVHEDGASIVADGLAQRDLSLLVATDAEALGRATWEVQVGTQEQTAATQLDVNLYRLADANAVLAMLQMRPLDVVRLDTAPDIASDVEDFMAQGGSLTCGPQQLAVSLFTTVVPAGDEY